VTRMQIILIPTGFFLAAVALSGEAEKIELGRLYIDPLTGFSLRPPVNTARTRTSVSSCLVTWTRRDEKTGAILWTLSVFRRSDPDLKDADLQACSRRLATRFRTTDRFEADSVEVAPLAGRPAVTYRGVAKGRVRFWQRRVWVLRQKQDFLEFRISGPTNMRNHLDEICSAVLATLEITDPVRAKVQRKTNLDRGGTLLAALTDKKLAALIRTGPHWFLYRRKGQAVGFMRQVELPATKSGKSGCVVKAWIWLSGPGEQVMRIRREMFTAADRSAETWVEVGWLRTDRKTTRLSERGSKTGEQIVCKVIRDGKAKTPRSVTAPKANYLPRAMVWLLGRMVNSETPASYAFATYDATGNNFNLRTFTVEGPEEIELSGRRVQAVRVTDQLSADAPPATMWIDKKGNLLIMEAAGGLVMEVATGQAVLRRFPNAEEIIKTMGP